MGGCQHYGPFLGTLNIRCRIIIGTQKGTIILTTTHVVKDLKPKTLDSGRKTHQHVLVRSLFSRVLFLCFAIMAAIGGG